MLHEKKRWFFIVAFVLSTLVLLTACDRTLYGSERDIVLAYSETATDNLLVGMNANDYIAFARDFDSDMKEEIHPANFAAWKEDIDINFGKYLSRKVEKVTQADEFRVVVYQAEFDKVGLVTVTVAFHASDHSIAFLRFDSENASWSAFQSSAHQPH
jgi:hypothetical protein